jgi:hypothetical protein
MFHSNRAFWSPRLAPGALALIAVMTVGALNATPASAQGAWCAQYSGRGGGGTNCGFYTLQQCQWAVSGVGGSCSPSPWAVYGDEPRPPRKVRRQYR